MGKVIQQRRDAETKAEAVEEKESSKTPKEPSSTAATDEKAVKDEGKED